MSDYGNSKTVEFFAEAFLLYHRGEALPDEIRDYFDLILFGDYLEADDADILKHYGPARKEIKRGD
jgi:hypothetical protein